MVIHSPLLKESECLQSTPYLAHSRNKRSSPKILSEVSAVPGSSARFWRLCLCNNHKIRSREGWCGHSWTHLVRVCVCACMCMCVSAQLCLTLQPPGLYPTRLFCPWDFPGKNTAVGCHFLLQGGLSLTQGSSPHHLWFLHGQAGSWPRAPPGKPRPTWCPWQTDSESKCPGHGARLLLVASSASLCTGFSWKERYPSASLPSHKGIAGAQNITEHRLLFFP